MSVVARKVLFIQICKNLFHLDDLQRSNPDFVSVYIEHLAVAVIMNYSIENLVKMTVLDKFVRIYNAPRSRVFLLP